MPLLVPDRLYRSYEELSAEALRAMGITLLLCDLDYTLAPKSVRRPDADLREWIGELSAGGVRVMIVSNNRSGKRVSEFCAELGIPYEGHAGKPGTGGIRRAMARVNATVKDTALLGDKLLTDVLAANRAGITSLMVEPRGGALTAWQKVLHAMQEPFKEACRAGRTKKE